MAELHYTVSGRRGPTVLWLHGFMGSTAIWQPLIDRWPYEAIHLAVDLPGHGQSVGLPEEAYTMEATVEGLRAVLDEQEVERCVPVGYSMGGRTALCFAAANPDRCAALVVESASPGLRTETERADRRAVDAERATRLETGTFRAFLHDWYRQPLFDTLHRVPGRGAALIEARGVNEPAELAAALRGMGTGAQPSLWERLPAWRVSTCALAGALDAKYVALTQAMAASSPRIVPQIVSGAGHNVHLEQPEAFVACVAPFIAHR